MEEKEVDAMIVTGLDETACTLHKNSSQGVNIFIFVTTSNIFFWMYATLIVFWEQVIYIIAGLLNLRAADIAYNPFFLSYIIVEKQGNATT